jgi:U3 small nucleolar RNA-associated protein 19
VSYIVYRLKPFLFNLILPLLPFHLLYRSFVRYLPAYLVAAFLKRMARLALFAPPAAVLAILPMIYNLLQRHPSCLVLLHRMPENQSLNETTEALLGRDPYQFDEQDPSKADALQSSLWELEVLKKHLVSAVSSVVHRFSKKIDEKQLSVPVEDFFANTTTKVTNRCDRNIYL